MRNLIKILVIIFIVSCATTEVKKTPKTSTSFKTLRKLELKLKNNANTSKIKAFINTHYGSEVGLKALKILAEYHIRKGNSKDAIKTYNKMLVFFFDNRADILHKLAQLYLEIGEINTAKDLAHEAFNDSTKRRLRISILNFLIEIYKSVHAPYKVVESYMMLIKEEPALTNTYILQSETYLDNISDLKSVEIIAKNPNFGSIRLYALFKLAVAKFDQKNFYDAKTHFENIINISPKSGLSEKSINYLRQIRARNSIDSYKIGVILPLSSNHSKVAYKTLHGLELGLGLFNEKGNLYDSKFSLSIIDSKGNANIAEKGVEKLIVEDQIIAIVGSILNSSAEVIAKKANSLEIPLISLAQRKDILDIGSFIFTNNVTSKSQVRKIAEVAIKNNLKRFAILYPEDSYGKEYAFGLWDEIEKLGGEVTAVAGYAESNPDLFKKAIQKLIGTYYGQDRSYEYSVLLSQWQKNNLNLSSRKKIPKDLLPAIVDFDAIFIPDSIKSIGIIAPMLSYNDIYNVPILGTNLLNSPLLIFRGGKNVEGAIFVDSFIKTDQKFLNSEFYKKFKQIFKYEPGIFEIIGYESGALLKKLIIDGARDRIDLKEALISTKNFKGVTTYMSVNSNRQIDRELLALTVKNKKIVLLEDKPLKKSLTK